jgi:hypothetical protein
VLHAKVVKTKICIEIINFVRYHTEKNRSFRGQKLQIICCPIFQRNKKKQHLGHGWHTGPIFANRDEIILVLRTC